VKPGPFPPIHPPGRGPFSTYQYLLHKGHQDENLPLFNYGGLVSYCKSIDKKNTRKYAPDRVRIPIFAPKRMRIMRRDVFQGIADPTRRAILGRLVKERLNLTTLADDYNISRQSVTKHIRILEGCGLVTIEKQGRDRCVKAKPEKLAEVARWVEQFSSFFAASFDRLDDYLKNME
jgi:DNA-binding transcriptional ArsR family regulator